MNVSKILKIAYLFEQRIKEASVRGNMAKRIMFSLLSHLVPENEKIRISYTRGAIDVKALRQMIPGAKELIEYGIIACLDEISWHQDSEAVNRIKKISSIGNEKYTLKALIIFFSRKDWADSYGGENWKKIAKTLLDINEHLNNSLSARKSHDVDREVEELMNLTVYLNVLDGLVHNTGSIMDKILDIEGGKQNRNLKSVMQEKKQVERLMDTKELKDPDEVLQEILPILDKETDAPLTMKDWIAAARRRKHNYKGSQEEIDKKLSKIRLKKQLMNIMPISDLDNFKKEIQSWSRIADNKLIDKVVNNRLKFIKVRSFINFINENPYFSSMPQDINNKLRSLTLVSQDRFYLSKITVKDILKAVWDVYDLLFLIEKFLDSLSE